MTAMQRIELCLVNLGYVYTKPYEYLIKAHKVQNVEDTIIIKKIYNGYYIVSDRCLKLYKCVGITETTATDVIRRVELMNKED